MATSTPWGASQNKEVITKGIIFYSTSSHGGFKVSPVMNARIHPAWRNRDGWYEEDMEWAIVALSFPEFFADKEVADAENTLIHWMPHQYMEVTGEEIGPGESRKLEEEHFRLTHADDYIAMSALSTFHDKRIPGDMVGVIAGRGGRLERGGYPDDTRMFLVDRDEYIVPRQPWESFVIDPSRHEEIELL